MDRAGLPKGVLSVVFGRPEAITGRLIESPLIRHVSFTGSVEAGRLVAAAAGRALKPAIMELGGHAPALILADADAEAAAAALARAKARNAGQVCVSPSRFYVHKSVFDRFVEKFAEVFKNLAIGPGLEPASQMGPMFQEPGLQRALDLIEDAVGKGAALLTGGERLAERGLGKGYFLSPAALAGVRAGSRLLIEEPFCPVAPIMPFDDLSEALEAANGVGYGLAAYVFTKSLRDAGFLAKNLKAGMVGVNQTALSQAETPFGGVGDSGWGREGGLEGLEGYLAVKLVNQLA
jgi:succinate-semialdehyde dehydrogenase/glutarate-semialdehyde dehydrogenase